MKRFIRGAKDSKYGHVSFPIIEQAVKGKADAIDEVLSHYRGYIINLCIRSSYNNDGICCSYVDEVMQHQIESKLVMQILQFKAA